MTDLGDPPRPHFVELVRDPLQFDLEQYRALRAEIIQAMADGNASMALGLTAVGLVTNAALSAYESAAGFVLLALVLPMLTGFVMSLWFAAQERMARASYFLSGLEHRLQKMPELKGRDTWELWLRPSSDDSGNRHFWSTQDAAFGLFGVIAIASIGLSIGAGSDDVPIAVKLTSAAMVTSMLGFGAIAVGRRYKAFKRMLSEVRVSGCAVPMGD